MPAFQSPWSKAKPDREYKWVVLDPQKQNIVAAISILAGLRIGAHSQLPEEKSDFDDNGKQSQLFDI
jgi:hypothetical protein